MTGRAHERTGKAVTGNFHARSERGVRREPCAHFNLVAMTRLFADDGDGLLADIRGEGKGRQAVNLANAVAIGAIGLGDLPRAQAMTRMAEGIPRVCARLRPGWSYPRRSMKPASEVEPTGKGHSLEPEDPQTAGTARNRQARVLKEMPLADGRRTMMVASGHAKARHLNGCTREIWESIKCRLPTLH